MEQIHLSQLIKICMWFSMCVLNFCRFTSGGGGGGSAIVHISLCLSPNWWLHFSMPHVWNCELGYRRLPPSSSPRTKTHTHTSIFFFGANCLNICFCDSNFSRWAAFFRWHTHEFFECFDAIRDSMIKSKDTTQIIALINYIDTECNNRNSMQLPNTHSTSNAKWACVFIVRLRNETVDSGFVWLQLAMNAHRHLS